MTYKATVEFRFNSTFTPSAFNPGFYTDDFLPEEHYVFTAPASDLNAKQYFRLFEKFLLAIGLQPGSIRSGAMNLVFNDWTDEKEMRKVCDEYELTMAEDLDKKYQEWKERDAQWAKMNAHYEKNFGSEPKIKGDWDTSDEVEN